MKIEVLRTKADVAATYEQAEIIRSHENIACNAPSASQITKRLPMWDADKAIEAAENGEKVEIHFF